MFVCKQCPEKFSTDSSRGLSLHQKKCSGYIRQTENILNVRRTLGSQKLKQRSTLKARKLRLQDNATRAIVPENKVCRSTYFVLLLIK